MHRSCARVRVRPGPEQSGAMAGGLWRALHHREQTTIQPWQTPSAPLCDGASTRLRRLPGRGGEAQMLKFKIYLNTKKII